MLNNKPETEKWSFLFQFQSQQQLFRTHLKRFNLFPFPSRINHYYYHYAISFKPIIIKSSGFSLKNNTSKCNSSINGEDTFEESEYVEVFGLGSRKDAILDYCSASNTLSPVLRFWNIAVKDASGVQLQLRYPLEDVQERDPEVPSSLHLSSKGVILVASTGYSYDHLSLANILGTVKAGSGLVVSIILKPFSFEGRKRQDEVKNLILDLKKLSNFCIVIDTDALLEKDLVTLDEALKYSNKAILMAINAVSSIISDSHSGLLVISNDHTRDLKVSEFIKILGRHKEGKIGFGSSHSMKTSVLQAICGCPFLGDNVQASDVLIGCIHSNPDVIDSCDMGEIIEAFHLTPDFKGKLVLSLMPDPQMEPKLVVTTVMAFSYSEKNTSQETSILSRLVQRFPFMLRAMNKQKEQIRDTWESFSSEIKTVNSDQTEDTSFGNSIPENIETYPDMIQHLSIDDDDISPVRDDGCDSGQTDVEFFEASSYSSTTMLNQEGIPSFTRELLPRQNLGASGEVTEHVREGIKDMEVGSVGTTVNVFNLPIGVKQSRHLKDYPNSRSTKQQSDPRMSDTIATVNMLRDRVSKATLGAVADLAKNGVLCEDKISDTPFRRQGVLAGRAASMLEAERHSQKQLTRIVKMRYRGGSYRGHVQGGLPEGKGCLTLPDGCAYDGMWRYGKRSGLGLFFFNNGDRYQGSWRDDLMHGKVYAYDGMWRYGKRSGLGLFFFNNGDRYQGSWRDDLMHGKGWIYFQSGDRWFANFWKGEANGEGRFYTKDGDIFFGHFKDGWRNGEFLHVSVDGTRFREVWDEGILVSHMELDPDASDPGSG